MAIVSKKPLNPSILNQSDNVISPLISFVYPLLYRHRTTIKYSPNKIPKLTFGFFCSSRCTPTSVCLIAVSLPLFLYSSSF